MRTGAARRDIWGTHNVDTSQTPVSEVRRRAGSSAQMRKTNPIRFTQVDAGLPQLTPVDAFLENAERTHRKPREQAPWALRSTADFRSVISTRLRRSTIPGAITARLWRRHPSKSQNEPTATPPVPPPTPAGISSPCTSPRPQPLRPDLRQGAAPSRHGGSGTTCCASRTSAGCCCSSLLRLRHHRASTTAQRPSARVQQQEQLGQFFFMFFSMFCVCAMALIGPVLTSHGDQRRAAAQDAARAAHDADHRVADRLRESSSRAC